MATSTRKNKFYHHKTYFQRSIKRKRTWKSTYTSKDFKSVITLRTPNKVTLEPSKTTIILHQLCEHVI